MKHLRLLLGATALFAFAGASPLWADDDPVEKRDYYQSLTTYAVFPKTIHATTAATAADADPKTAPAHVYLGGFTSTDGVWFTLLAYFGTAKTDAATGVSYNGYVVAGKCPLTEAEIDAYNTKLAEEEKGNFPDYTEAENEYKLGFYGEPTFCAGYTDLVDSQKLLDLNNTANYSGAASLSDHFIALPMYITTNDYSGDGSLASSYRNKTWKVVGVDFGAFSYTQYAQIVLPSSVTYIGDSGLRASGGDADGVPSRALAFHTGAASYPYIGATITKTDDAAAWMAANSIEAFGRYSLSVAHYDDIDDVVDVNTLKYYDDYCFRGWEHITSLDFGKTVNVHRVGTGAFAYCSNLKSIRLTNNITEIATEAFENCPELESITYDTDSEVSLDGLLNIGTRAFVGCSKLKTLVLPPTVKYIGSQAFERCGLSGRFDLPTSLTYVGDRAFALNGITYIPFLSKDGASPINASGLFLGESAFYEENDITVEFDTDLAPEIISNERPFETDAAHRVRIIVPLSSGERYVHGLDESGKLRPISGLFSKYYHHHEYRVKFNLNGTYAYPQYGLPTGKDGDEFTYATIDWRVASTAWTNDIYAFVPSHGGTVDQWIVYPNQTNNLGETVTSYKAENSFYIDPGTDLDDTSDDFQVGTQHVFPRTAHQYFDNQGIDRIPRISTQRVNDGIIPPDEGLLLEYNENATYLVPLYADYGLIDAVVDVVPQMNNVIVNNPPDTLTRLRIEQKMAQFDTGILLKQLDYWLDLNEHTARWRDIAVWADDGMSYEMKVVDLLNNVDEDGNPFVVDRSKKVTVGKYIYGSTGFPSGGSYVNKGTVVPKYDYHISSSGRPYRCHAYFNKYKIPESINWTEAWEAGRDYLYELLKPYYQGKVDIAPNFVTNNQSDIVSLEYNEDIGAEGYHKVLNYLLVKCTYTKTDDEGNVTYCGNAVAGYNGGKYNYGLVNIQDWHCRQWIDIFDLVEVKGKTMGEIKNGRHDFQDLHTDHGNVLIPCVERTMVYPYWLVVSDADYEAADAIRRSEARLYSQDDDGKWSYTTQKVVGKDAPVMSGDQYVEGYMSFGLKSGYFARTNSAGLTRANSAYFRVPSSALVSEIYGDTEAVPSGARMLIVDEADMTNPPVTGISQTRTATAAGGGTWRTLDGRSLNGRPTQSGIYIQGNRKVFVK